MFHFVKLDENDDTDCGNTHGVQERLLNAMEPCLQHMTDAERARNRHGPHLLYEYVAEPLEKPFPSTVPGRFPDISPNHTKSVFLWMFVRSVVFEYALDLLNIFLPVVNLQ